MKSNRNNTPFFARFLSSQDLRKKVRGKRKGVTKKYPSDSDEGKVVTLKYPSDAEDGGFGCR